MIVASGRSKDMERITMHQDKTALPHEPGQTMHGKNAMLEKIDKSGSEVLSAGGHPSPASIDVWLLHASDDAEDYTVRLRAGGPVMRIAGPGGEDAGRMMVQVAAGRSDIDWPVMSMRVREAAEKARWPIGDDVGLELATVDELIHLAGSWSNSVHPFAGRRHGVEVPREVIERIAELGGPYLPRQLKSVPKEIGRGRASRASRISSLFRRMLGRKPAAHSGSGRLKAEEAIKADVAEEFATLSAGCMVAWGMWRYAISAAGTEDNGAVRAIEGLLLGLAAGMGLISAWFMLRPKPTSRFRDSRSGKIGDLLRYEERMLVRWDNSRERVDELLQRKVPYYQIFDDGLVVSPDGERLGRFEGERTVMIVEWYGKAGEESLDPGRIVDFKAMQPRAREGWFGR